MIKLIPDIIAKLRIYNKEEGGIYKKPILPITQFRTLFAFENQKNDCAILLDQIGISLNVGEWTEVPIKFAVPQLIKPHLQLGSKFKLWERGYIGEGEVIKIIDASAQEGSFVALTIDNEVLRGKIINSWKSNTNNLRSIVKLDKPILKRESNVGYLLVEDRRTGIWKTDSFTGVDTLCVIVSVSQKEINSSDILEKDYFQDENKTLDGHIRLIDD